MKIIPNDPEAIRDDTMLARYLRADPARIAVLNRVLSLLDDDGRVGDAARYYAIRNPLRRSILRGVLIAEGIPLPSWLIENRAAREANQQFAQAYRQARRDGTPQPISGPLTRAA